MNGLKLGSEVPIHDNDGEKLWSLRVAGGDGDVSFWRHNSSGVEQEEVIAFDSTTGNLTITGDVAITGAVTVTGALTTTEGDVSYRSLANDAACEIGRLDAGGTIELLNSTTGTKSITTDTSGANAVALGQIVTIFLTACTGNSYTLALSTGTLTFNAALECASIVRTSLGWNVVSLNGATIV